jgi:hypothetical protein
MTAPAQEQAAITDQETRHRAVRRLANASMVQTAQRYGAGEFDVLQFVCECGIPGCDLLVTLAICEFDPGSAPGSVVAIH